MKQQAIQRPERKSCRNTFTDDVPCVNNGSATEESEGEQDTQQNKHRNQAMASGRLSSVQRRADIPEPKRHAGDDNHRFALCHYGSEPKSDFDDFVAPLDGGPHSTHDDDMDGTLEKVSSTDDVVPRPRRMTMALERQPHQRQVLKARVFCGAFRRLRLSQVLGYHRVGMVGKLQGKPQHPSASRQVCHGQRCTCHGRC